MLQEIKLNEFYTVFSDGSVYSHITEKFIVPDVSNRSGYLRVTLYRPRKRWLLHRLVAELFVPKVEGANFVNHKDGDKTNCDKENLEWTTREENEQHAYDSGLRPNQVTACTINGIDYPSIASAARALGVGHSSVQYRLNSDGFPNYVVNA